MYLIDFGNYFHFLFFSYAAIFRCLHSNNSYKTCLKTYARLCKAGMYIVTYHSPAVPFTCRVLRGQTGHVQRCSVHGCASPGCAAACRAALSAVPGGSPWGSSASPTAAPPRPLCEPCPPAAGFHCGLRAPIRPPPSVLFPPACSGTTEIRLKFTNPASLCKDRVSQRNPTLY